MADVSDEPRQRRLCAQLPVPAVCFGQSSTLGFDNSCGQALYICYVNLDTAYYDKKKRWTQLRSNFLIIGIVINILLGLFNCPHWK